MGRADASKAVAHAEEKRKETREPFDERSRGLSRRRVVLLSTLFVIGAGSITWFVLFAFTSAKEHLQARFRDKARLMSHGVQLALKDHTMAVMMLKTHMDSKESNATREVFHAFTHTLHEVVPATAFLLARAVDGPIERARLETSSTAFWNEHLGLNKSSYPIVDRGIAEVRPAAIASTYFPVIFIDPPSVNASWAHYNLYTHSAARSASLAEALETGKLTSYGPLASLSGPGVAVVLEAPLLHGNATVMDVVHVPELVAHGVKTIPVGLELYLFATDSEGGGDASGMLCYGAFSDEMNAIQLHTLAELEDRTFRSEVSFEQVGKSWKVVVVSNDDISVLDSTAIVVPASLLGVLFVGFAILSVVAMKREENYIRNKAVFAAEHARGESQAVARAERHLNDFLAHEVRNPLSVAIAAQRFLQSSLQDASWANPAAAAASERDLDLIGSSLAFILELVSNMLDLNKFLEEQQVSLSPMRVALGPDVLEPVRSMLELSSTTVRVEVALDESEMWVDVDALRLKQVVMNLAKNAIKFVEEGFVRLVAHRVSPYRVVIAIEDSGPGVPAHKQGELFGKYQESLDKMQQGTGIGLCLGKLIVESMGGNIYLDTTYDSGVPNRPGARFVVELPLPAAEAPSSVALQRHRTDEAVLSEAPRRFFRGSSFLVVDDDAIIRATIKRRLGLLFEGVTVHLAASGEAALALIDQRAPEDPFAVVFMDHYMPGPGSPLTGAEVIQQLRRKGYSGLIFGCSANDVRQLHLSAGADMVFRKPLPPNPELVHSVVSVAALRRLRAVLLVDDQEINLLVLERLLRPALPATCRIDKVHSAELALELHRAHQYDVIVLDENLGVGMRGSEAARRLRSAGRCSAVLISLSGGALSPSAVASFDLCWSKPLPKTDKVRADLADALVAHVAAAGGPSSP